MLWNGNESLGAPHVLAGAMRYRTSRGEQIDLDTQNIKGLLDGVPVPRTPFERVDLILRDMDRRTSVFGERVRYGVTDFPVVFAHDHAEFNQLLSAGSQLGYIEHPDSAGWKVTLRGWQRLEELKTAQPESDQAFVAMWFSHEVDAAWTDGIKPALETVGYVPMRIDNKEHNEKIDDHIVAEIRRSGLLVADFTNHRNGVYFEAGFALGLGIPVIWTCRADYMTDEDGKRPHFDTRQYNHIVWTTPEELRDRLVARIEATIPGRVRL